MSTSLQVLFAGQEATATLRDGTTHRVRVRELPVRHHLELIDLFDLGREAALIERCTERLGDTETRGQGEPSPNSHLPSTSVDAAWVDQLTDASHAELAQLAETLNFTRAIATAERQIARAQTLRPMKERMAATMLAPLRNELASWTSSLMQALSSASAAKPPSEKH